MNELKKSINIVFLGGSITQGASASIWQNNYIMKIAEYFKQTYTDKEVNFKNAGVGGTGSVLGVFRLNKDCISFKPDIVFVEFANNDIDETKETSQICMEGIVRQLLKLPCPPIIIFIYTTNIYRNAVGINYHQQIADYYNIPSIDLQQYIWDEIEKGKFKWEDKYSDWVHPNDYGHELYAEYIIKTIDKNKSLYLHLPTKQEMPFTNYGLINPRLLDFTNATYKGLWKQEQLPYKSNIERAISSSNAGDALEFEFFGRCIGLYHIASTDAGIAEITIDNNPPFEVDMYKNMDVPYCLVKNINLKNEKHKMLLKVSNKRNADSIGNYIRIGYFLIE